MPFIQRAFRWRPNSGTILYAYSEFHQRDLDPLELIFKSLRYDNAYDVTRTVRT